MDFDKAMKELDKEFLMKTRNISILDGYDPDEDKDCTWTEEQKREYIKKLVELDPLLYREISHVCCCWK